MEYWIELLRDIVIHIVSVVGIFMYSEKTLPNLRGFYCNDDSLRLSYIDRKNWHVSMGTLLGVSLSLPIVCIILLEYLRIKEAANKVNAQTPWHIVGYHIHITLRNWAFAFNFMTILTEMLKYSVGRLRPHFIEVCEPEWDAIQCSDVDGDPLYIADIPCRATDLSRLKEARKSFPSGHALVATFAMVHLVIYLHVRNRYLPKPLILLLQSVCLAFAAYTSVTRVIDQWHHSTDVLAGVGIGTLLAVLSTKFASELFTNNDGTIIGKEKNR